VRKPLKTGRMSEIELQKSEKSAQLLENTGIKETSEEKNGWAKD
jgi:hypothetical protein